MAPRTHYEVAEPAVVQTTAGRRLSFMSSTLGPRPTEHERSAHSMRNRETRQTRERKRSHDTHIPQVRSLPGSTWGRMSREEAGSPVANQSR